MHGTVPRPRWVAKNRPRGDPLVASVCAFEAFFAFDHPTASGTIANPCGGEYAIDPVPAD